MLRRPVGNTWRIKGDRKKAGEICARPTVSFWRAGARYLTGAPKTHGCQAGAQKGYKNNARRQ
jgi:hypothetical protein